MTPRVKYAHCSYCGQAYVEAQPWPRHCGSCQQVSYVNPTPVVVAVVPVEEGVLCVRRSIPPAAGKLALPGGFLEIRETWQEGLARELREETGLVVDPDDFALFRAASVPRDGLLLLFGLATPRTRDQLSEFSGNTEVSELLVLSGPQELAFPTHTQVVADYFGT